MRLLLITLTLFLSSMANAQTITVQSGEHDGFTRLALTFPKLGDWTLKREVDGYSLVVGGVRPNYDLSNVFQRISKDRLTKIYVEAGGGALKLTIGCACYATPFEFEKGIFVIDIKDGTPPTGSSFELSGNGEPMPPLTDTSLQRPVSKPKEFLSLPTTTPAAANVSTPTLSVAISEAARLPPQLNSLEKVEKKPSLDQVKKDLLWQLSKGAAEGVVEIEKPFRPMERTTSSDQSQTNLRIGADVGLVPNTKKRQLDRMTGLGDSCIPDTRLAIGAWASDDDVVSGFALGTTKLVGEFDHPDPDAISRAVQYYLALGFGAEARLVLGAFKSSSQEKAIWETLSYIVDLERPPGDVFTNMEVCDTSAALWSLLSSKDIPPPNQIAVPAVLRSFSELPLHLRRLLGPELASRFLSRNDMATARAIRDAILRAPGSSGDRVQMLEAEIALANGQTALAEGILMPISGGTGPLGIRSTVTLIQSQVDAGEDVALDLVTTAESLLQEARGGEDEELLIAALALGYASQNKFGDAFALVAPDDPKAMQIWAVLATRGNDESLLRWALLQKSETPPQLGPVLAGKTARRLLDLGFPQQALNWLTTNAEAPLPDDENTRLMAAEAEISLNSLTDALSHLDGLKGEAANRLRGIALAGLHADQAGDYLTQSGQEIEAANLAKQTRDWSRLSDLAQGGVWQDAAALVQPVISANDPAGGANSLPVSEATDFGPLAQTRAALEESTAARAILDKLLAEQVVQGAAKQ